MNVYNCTSVLANYMGGKHVFLRVGFTSALISLDIVYFVTKLNKLFNMVCELYHNHPQISHVRLQRFNTSK